MRRLIDWIRARVDELAAMDRFDLVLRVSLLYLLLKPVGGWYFKFPLLVLCAWGLLSRTVRQSGWLWLLLFWIAAARVLVTATVADNHVYLIAYWCLAVLVAITVRESDRTLATSARMLIGLAFLFAVIWKAFLSPDFMSGDFFRGTFLFDQRFRDLSFLFGGQTPEAWVGNMRTLNRLRAGVGGMETATFVEPARQALVAQLVTWWTVISESAVAIAFLAPPASWLGRIRHWTLLGFTWTTYIFATVTGFGWLLMVMGVAQCEPERRWTRALYVLTFALVWLHTVVPWTTWLAAWALNVRAG